MDNDTDIVEKIALGADDIEHDEIINSDNLVGMNDSLGPWNKKMIMLLKNVGEKALGYRWMHDVDAAYYAVVDYKFAFVENIFLAILTTFTSGSIFIILFNTGIYTNVAAMAIINIIILLITLVYIMIKGAHEIGKYGDLVRAHKYSALKYHNVSSDIQEQLTLDVAKRDNDKQFITNVLKIFKVVQYEAPDIRIGTKNSYLSAIEQDKISKPINFNDFDTIEIVIENPANIQDKTLGSDVDKSESSIIRKLKGIGTNYNPLNFNTKYNYEINRYLRNF